MFAESISAEPKETAIVTLVLIAAACVLGAPIAGRLGAPFLANVLAVTAAACGLASFGIAGAATLSAVRRAGRHGAGHRRPGGGPERPHHEPGHEPDRHAEDER